MVSTDKRDDVRPVGFSISYWRMSANPKANTSMYQVSDMSVSQGVYVFKEALIVLEDRGESYVALFEGY